ncbi:lysylphosphatidylglycerol synthase transmembrane domain-containing protein [Ferruginibacter albus]|uniref:lysylphosphatidylglycerol synthase transmembrane domain-containing protein n=1 Tax=Ferruginibacter albus TaxID=2875540 RepID=UPI001CC36ED9|nr:lysylphosphatidylglycerol synthase transmembrane domain-containing protein [Ferruginibacter albus]UAY51070.1 flippase-like domain-containing protein [Ferruginibacter albus]
MNKRLRTILNYTLFLGIGVFLVWWQFHKMTNAELEKFKFALSNANYWLIIPVIIMAISAHISRAMRWKILIHPLGYNPSLFNTFSCVMSGYLANSFLPRFGEILRCTLLARYEKIPAEKLLGTIVFERIFDLLCYLIFIGLTILIQFKLVGSFIEESLENFIHSSSAEIALIKIIIAIVVLILVIIFIRRFFKKNSTSPIAVRLRNFFTGLSEGITTVKKMKQRRWFLAHTFFIWTMYLLQIYVGFNAIKEVSHLGLDAACSVLTLATIAMIVMPGGLGAFPKAVAWVLLLYSIEEPIGEAFGFLMWGVTTFIVLLFGIIFSVLMYYVNKKKQDAIS